MVATALDMMVTGAADTHSSTQRTDSMGAAWACEFPGNQTGSVPTGAAHRRPGLPCMLPLSHTAQWRVPLQKVQPAAPLQA